MVRTISVSKVEEGRALSQFCPTFDMEKWSRKQVPFFPPLPLNNASIEEQKTADTPFLFYPEGKVPHIAAITERSSRTESHGNSIQDTHISWATLGPVQLSSLLQ